MVIDPKKHYTAMFKTDQGSFTIRAVCGQGAKKL